MKNIEVLEKFFSPYISQEEIDQKVAETARTIHDLFCKKNPIFLVVLNGAFRFAGDISTHIDFPCEWQFVKLTSYKGMQSSGSVQESDTLTVELKNRNVIVLEDIVDTGNSMHYFLNRLKELEPESLTMVSLFVKPEVLQERIKVDIVGFEIPNKFIVGYGLDYNEAGRNINGIWQVVE